jgi:hypothetical protein
MKMHRSSFLSTSKSTEFQTLVKSIAKESTLKGESKRIFRDKPMATLEKQLDEID